MRIFIIVFAIEALFILFYVFGQEQLRGGNHLSVVALTAFLVLFFELLALNAKMGLVSQYLRQLETYLASLGYEGLFWETKALDKIIFPFPNVFTFPAFITVLMLCAQLSYAFYFAISEYFPQGISAALSSGVIFVVLTFSMVIILKGYFYRNLPKIFEEKGSL